MTNVHSFFSRLYQFPTARLVLLVVLAWISLPSAIALSQWLSRIKGIGYGIKRKHILGIPHHRLLCMLVQGRLLTIIVEAFQIL